MRAKHYSRQRVQKQRQRRRRYPFDDYTMLCQLFDSTCFKRLDKLAAELKPYLRKDCLNLRRSTGIFLSDEGLTTVKRQWLYGVIGEAVSPDKNGDSPLAVSKNVFFRYLSDAAHSNLGLSESTLKASVNKVVSLML